MVASADYPANTVKKLKFNTLPDGFFHASIYLFVGIGLNLLQHGLQGWCLPLPVLRRLDVRIPMKSTAKNMH